MLIEQSGGTVWRLFVQIGPQPVKYRHKIIADHFYAGFGQIFNRSLVFFNIQISRRQPKLYILMDVNAFNNFNVKPVLFALPLHF